MSETGNRSRIELNENKKLFIDTLVKSGKSLQQPLLACVFGLVVGALVCLMYGTNPLRIYKEMFQKSFFSQYYFLTTLTRATPIILCSMATGAAWRAGHINLGVEGQMVIGSFAAALVAIYVPGPPVLVTILAILAGMIVGALYALIPALINLKLGVSLVISTLMLNYVSSYVVSYLIAFPFRDTSTLGSQALQTELIPKAMQNWILVPKTTFNFAFVIACVVTVVFYLISKYTVFGYETRMSGLNRSFANYGGVKGAVIVILTMAISGMIASMAGLNEVFGYKFRYIDGMLTSTRYAWTGLMSALIAGLNPIGMFIVSIFLAGLQIGGQAVQRTVGIPLEMATIIQCCMTLFVSVKIGLNFKTQKQAKEPEKEVTK